MSDCVGLGVVETDGTASAASLYPVQDSLRVAHNQRYQTDNPELTHDRVHSRYMQEAGGTLSTFTESAGTIRPSLDNSTCDSNFSRDDSLFSFGVSSFRNADELKFLLGDAHSRLKPGAKVPSVPKANIGKDTAKPQSVTLEQAKPRARVEVDIALESDCCVEGGYMRGSIKLRIRRQKKEAPMLLTQGKVRVIGFECIPGKANRHTFYQRASLLSAITDAYTGIYDSPPDAEGYSRAMEGVHVLPFSMHLPINNPCGSAKGSLSLQPGVQIRYIVMVSVKVKDSTTGKRSIAHFYRDCQVWPRLNPSVVLASAPRPIQATTAKSLSVIGNGSKLKLTAMLHRITWIAGQRCYVAIRIVNETKKSVKSVVLTLVRTTTLFKPKPHLDPGNGLSIDPDACQTSTTHKVVAETVLERSQGAARGHASVEGWWTGVQAGQEAQFSHYILMPVDALSVYRTRLIEVEYSIRVTVSAGALTPDVHVTLPVRIINFLSVDPTPSAPLLSHLLSNAQPQAPSLDRDASSPSASGSRFSLTAAVDERAHSTSTFAFVPSLGVPHPPTVRTLQTDALPARHPSAVGLDKPLSHPTSDFVIASFDSIGNEMTHECVDRYGDEDGNEGEVHPADHSLDSSFESNTSSCSVSPSISASNIRKSASQGCRRELGNLELDEDAGSDEEVDFVVGTAQMDTGCFQHVDGPRARLDDHVDSGIWDAEEVTYQSDPVHMKRESSDHEAYATTSYVTLGKSEPVRSSRHQSNPQVDRRCVSNAFFAGPDEMAPSRNVPNAVFIAGSSEGGGRRTVAASLSGSRENHHSGICAVRHNRKGATRRELLVEDAAKFEDDGATPRLFTAEFSGANVNLSDTEVSPTSASDMRRSRQLPQPPSRPSHLCNIPASVSALESLQMSQICSTHFGANEDEAAQPSEPTSRSLLPRSAAARSLPASPIRSKGPSFPTSVSSRPSHQRSETVPSSISASTIHTRPKIALRNTGQSDCSVVKGRIAAFEERLRVSRVTGASYA